MNYIFFDLDGTLHQEDILKDYLYFMISHRTFFCLLLFPFFLTAILIYQCFSKKNWSLSLLYYLTHLGLTTKQQHELEQAFIQKFLAHYSPIQSMLKQLKQHLIANDHVFIISGSPQQLIEQIYPQFVECEKITIIGSETKHKWFSHMLTQRCFGMVKAEMLAQKCQHQMIDLDIGYSDSMTDLPLLKKCRWGYLVDKTGKLTLIK